MQDQDTIDSWIEDHKDSSQELIYFPLISFQCSIEGGPFKLSDYETERWEN